jgi:hypothetical protein
MSEGKPMRIQTITCVLLLCFVCSGCGDTIKGVILAGAHVIKTADRITEEFAEKAAERAEEAANKRRQEERVKNYGRDNCPDAFIDMCWEFYPAEAGMTGSAPPPWETYQKIVGHLREQPLPLDDERSLNVYKGVRRVLNELTRQQYRVLNGLTRQQYAVVLADAARFINSPKAGDVVSAAILQSFLAQTMLSTGLHLSSPGEWKLAGQVASLLVPAYERALAELADQDACTLALAEFYLASAYEFAAFVEQDPAEKARLAAQAFAVYARATERTEDFPYWSLRLMAGIAGSRVAATDEERLELARRLTTTINLELRRDSSDSWSDVYSRTVRYQTSIMSDFSDFFLYDAVLPDSQWLPLFLGAVRPDSQWLPLFLEIDTSKLTHPTLLNMAILEIQENCGSAPARRAAVDILLGLYEYAVEAATGYIYEGAVAALLLELYVRSGDEHWLRAAPGYLRAGGDSLSANDWKELVKQARRQRAELLAQLDAPNLCRDADNLVIRWRGFLITDQEECGRARDLIDRYPLASEIGPAWLGAEYGTERYLLNREWPIRPGS